MVASARGRIGASIWLLVFRLLLGAASMVDGLSKLGVVHSAAPMNDLQPSPLGWLSPLLELVAGALVLVGFRARIAAAVLAAHLALGLLVNRRALTLPETGMDAFLLAVVLVFGSSVLSADHSRNSV